MCVEKMVDLLKNEALEILVVRSLSCGKGVHQVCKLFLGIHIILNVSEL